MSLTEELKPRLSDNEKTHEYACSLIAYKKQLADELEQQTAEFISKGGRIEVIGQGETVNGDKPVLLNEFNGGNDAETRLKCGKKGAEKCRAIDLKRTAFDNVLTDGESFYVSFRLRIIKQTFDTAAKAVNWLDYKRQEQKRKLNINHPQKN